MAFYNYNFRKIEFQDFLLEFREKIWLSLENSAKKAYPSFQVPEAFSHEFLKLCHFYKKPACVKGTDCNAETRVLVK